MVVQPYLILGFFGLKSAAFTPVSLLGVKFKVVGGMEPHAHF